MIDEKRIADFFAELVSIDSPSLEECEMADTLKAKFAEIGVNFTEDHTQEQTGSNAGNLFARIPGSIDGAPVLFAAHMDTVEPAKGKKAVFHDDGTVTSDGTTVLGADDLAGVTAIYEAVRHITEAGAPHSPIEILISTGEELYCKGANAFDPIETWKKTKIKGGTYTLRELLVPIFQKGACVYTSPSVMEIRDICTREKDTLWEESKRLVNPHEVYVDLSDKLYHIKSDLLEEMSMKALGEQ